MKNIIKEELRKLASEIIEENNKASTSDLKNRTLQLLEKFTILEYLEKQWTEVSEAMIKDTTEEEIPLQSMEDELNTLDETSDVHPEDFRQELPAEIQFSEEKEEDIENLREETHPIFEDEDHSSQSPIFELNEEPNSQEEQPEEEHHEQHQKTSRSIELELFAAEFQTMPEFERKASSAPASEEKENQAVSERPKSLNDLLGRSLTFGLNDRLAFVNHLFNGEMEDFTRVISQINTFESFEEVKDFIENNVKPDYNHWANKEEFSKRFMLIVEKAFS